MATMDYPGQRQASGQWDCCESVQIRSSRPADRTGFRRLDHVAAEDGGFSWVADANGRVVGTITLCLAEPDVARIRHLRVEPGWRGRGVARRLVGTAGRYAREQGCLKLILEAEILTERAVEVMSELGFQFVGERQDRGQRLLQFYLDLYRRPGRREQAWQ